MDDLKKELFESLKKEEPIKILQCAQTNFENVERMIPQIAKHPIWEIAKTQLDAALDNLLTGSR